MHKGLLITFEGLDACGKSTQIELLKKYINNRTDNQNFVFVKEPGGTKLGEKIRFLFQNYEEDSPSPKTELFLMLSSRAQLYDKLVKPSLEQGKIVIADRYIDSTIAYQAFGRDVLPIEEIKHLNALATENLQPDLTFYLKIKPEISYSRKMLSSNLDRFEKAPLSFFKKVYKGYEYLAETEAKRYHIINATDTISNIHNEIVSSIEKLIVAKIKRH